MIFTPGADIICIILNNKPIPLCPGVRNSLFSKSAPYTNILGKVVWNKDRWCLGSKETHRNTTDSWRTVSQHRYEILRNRSTLEPAYIQLKEDRLARVGDQPWKTRCWGWEPLAKGKAESYSWALQPERPSKGGIITYLRHQETYGL